MYLPDALATLSRIEDSSKSISDLALIVTCAPYRHTHGMHVKPVINSQSNTIVPLVKLGWLFIISKQVPRYTVALDVPQSKNAVA